MGSPINAFEVIESIRFFASLVGTEGISEYTKSKVNTYLERLVDSLERSVNETTASQSGLSIC